MGLTGAVLQLISASKAFPVSILFHRFTEHNQAQIKRAQGSEVDLLLVSCHIIVPVGGQGIQQDMPGLGQ